MEQFIRRGSPAISLRKHKESSGDRWRPFPNISNHHFKSFPIISNHFQSFSIISNCVNDNYDDDDDDGDDDNDDGDDDDVDAHGHM